MSCLTFTEEEISILEILETHHHEDRTQLKPETIQDQMWYVTINNLFYRHLHVHCAIFSFLYRWLSALSYRLGLFPLLFEHWGPHNKEIITVTSNVESSSVGINIQSKQEHHITLSHDSILYFGPWWSASVSRSGVETYFTLNVIILIYISICRKWMWIFEPV